MPDRMSDDRQWYEGTSAYMLWAPKVFLGMAVLTYLVHWPHWFQFSSTFVLVAFIHSRWLPWQFEIHEDGIQLLFPFGRRLFLNRSVATVRVDVVGAMVYNDRDGRKRWFGYPLKDGILFQPGNESLLRAAFLDRGFNVT
jgi:hypothetical protein